MPARRLSKYRQSKEKANNFGLVRLVLVLILLASGLVFLFKTEKWESDSKFILVINDSSGDVIVSTLDPDLEEMTNLLIPQDTEVDVAKNLGKWKIKSVWKLGENEKMDGELLRLTVVKNFNIPVNSWSDSSAEALIRGDLFESLKAILSLSKTNLNIADKIRVSAFSLSVKNSNRREYRLEDTAFLRKTQLVGGEKGYIISGSFPERFLSIFADQTFSKAQVKIAIKDATGTKGLAENVGETLELLGGKIVAKITEEPSDFDCSILSNNRKLGRKIKNIFDCNLGGMPSGNFDIEVKLGKRFAERF